MAVIDIKSVQDAIAKGKLIDLASDYRTSGTVRACLPRLAFPAVAISVSAYLRHVQSGTSGDPSSRLEAVCAFLSKALGVDGKPPQPDLEFKILGENGRGWNVPLKLEWYGPSKYWVILLTDEQLRAAVAPV